MDDPRKAPGDWGDQDDALADSFPASDPPSTSSPTESVSIDDEALVDDTAKR